MFIRLQSSLICLNVVLSHPNEVDDANVSFVGEKIEAQKLTDLHPNWIVSGRVFWYLGLHINPILLILL